MTSNESISEYAPTVESRRWASLIFLLFFLSGATSLIYEVIWVRKFGLVFGVTTYAVSTVLAAFFAGLAIGSYIAGRIIDRTRLHPLKVYGAMEGVIGVYALLLPLFLALVEKTYPAVYSSLGESFTLFTLFRFFICVVLLVVPTILMGATLPVLSKLLVKRESVLGLSVGRLYAANTFGAVFGTFSAGFLLIPSLGVPPTIVMAAVGNFALAVSALLLSNCAAFGELRVNASSHVGEMESEDALLTRTDRIILLLAFSSGLAALALEVIWTKSLVLILGSTTYAFSTMLTAVLVGIAAGSAIFARFSDPARNRGALVAVLFLAGGFCAVMGPGVINHLPFVFLRLYDWSKGVWNLLICAQFIICFLLVFIPTFLSGASFPILIRMHSHGIKQVGRTVADVYALNTLGGIVGSLVSGFLLVRFFGLQGSLIIAALFLMLVGGVLALALAKPWPSSSRIAASVLVIGVVLLLAFLHPRLDTKLLFGGWGPFAGGYYIGHQGGTTVDVTDRYMQRLLYHKEGVSASVDVLETGAGEKIISVNAQPVATTYLYDMRALKMLGHLPILLHPDPKQVLIIGLGAGVSSGIIASYPAANQVTLVELNEEVPGGTAKFSDWNFDVLNNPKVRVIINDGANYVKATRKQYDVISSDPIHPFISGNGILYSFEHWKICKDRLREGGILAQWLPLYQLSPTDFATIIGSFVDVFPNATIWFCGIDTVLIGAKGEFKIDPVAMASHMSDPVMAKDLLSMGVHQPADILGWYIAGPDQLRQMAAGAPRNHVEYPVLEFTAPKAINLEGVLSTMPALLTAVEQISSAEIRRQLKQICKRPLDPGTLSIADTARAAGKWLMRAQMLSSADYPSQYLDAARRAQLLRPTDQFVREALADAQFYVGLQQSNDGFPKSAYRSFYDSFVNDPRRNDSLSSAVFAAIQSGDLSLAEETLRLGNPRQREIFQMLLYEGLIALEKFNYEAARKAFQKAAGTLEELRLMRPRQEAPMLWIGLAIIELRNGKKATAHKYFDRAIYIATNKMEVLYDIVNYCMAHGYTADSQPYADSLVSISTGAIALDPGRPGGYNYRAIAYTALGEEVLAARDRATSRSLSGWWDEPIPLNAALTSQEVKTLQR